MSDLQRTLFRRNRNKSLHVYKVSSKRELRSRLVGETLALKVQPGLTVKTLLLFIRIFSLIKLLVN